MLTHKLILFQSMFVAIGSPEEMDKWDKMFEHEVTLDSPYCYNSLPWGVWEALHVHNITLTATDSIHDNINLLG